VIWIGLTGGIGAGKSSLGPTLDAMGWAIIDADELARLAVAPGTLALQKIAELFGPKALTPEGFLNRAYLARLVFTDPKLLAALEKITHQEIALLKQAALKALWEKDPEAKVVYLVPLLFEKAMGSQFQTTVLVEVDPEIQIARLIESRGMDPQDALRRITAQMPLDQKLALADHVIDNNHSLEAAQFQVRQLFGELAKLPHLSLDEILERK